MEKEKNERVSLIDLNLVRDLALMSCVPRTPGESQQHLFVPAGFVEKRIPALHEIPLPNHIRQTLSLVERESFTRYVKLYKSGSSQIFGTVTPEGAHFVAVLDYHESGNERTPNHTKHVATFAPKYSDDFKAWCLINGKALTQDQFLDHLRRWGDVITSHTDADMIEIVSNLDFHKTGQFSSQVERVTGGRKLTFNEEIEGTSSSKSSKIPVPDVMKMNSEIFQGGAKFDYSADLLYRVNGGKLTIAIELKRPHKVVKEAIDSLIADIVTETEITPLIGTVVLDS